MNRIEINVSNVAGNIIGKLDIGEAEINTIYQLSDVMDPTTKTTNHTKTFTIPGTKLNNQIFQHIYEGGFSSFSYNPNLKLNAQVLVNGNQYFSGALQLNDIIKVDNKIIGYDITIYGLFGMFFNNITNFKLIDIVDLSDFNHEWDTQTIAASWQYWIRQNGLITPFSLGNGYVYPLEYRGEVSNLFDAESMKPAIYVKTIFDRVLKSQGVSYESDFLNSTLFRKLIMPYTGEDKIALSASQSDAASTWVKTSETTSGWTSIIDGDSKTNKFYPPVQVGFDDAVNPPAHDTNGNWSSLYKIMTVPKNGTYNLAVTVPLRVWIEAYSTEAGGGHSYPEPYVYWVGGPFEMRLRLVNLSTGVTLNSVAETLVDSRWNSGNPHNMNLTTGEFTEEIRPSTSWTGPLHSGNTIAVYIDWWSTASNFTYKFRHASALGIALNQVNLYTHLIVDNKTFTPGSSGTYDPYSTAQFEMVLIDEKVSLGDTMDMNAFVPDMKAVDFIKEINKLFNLYWIEIGDNKFKIEPRNDFYKTGSIHDWTYQIDNAEEIKIEPLYDLQDKKYIFTYAEDNDYYNEDYMASYDEVYGSKSLEVNNDFVVETQEVKSLFGACPTVQHLNSNRMLPEFVKDDSGLKSNTKTKTRIIFYGGLKTTTQWKMFDKYINLSSSFYKYPYTGHLDDWENPTNDLSWGTPKKLYFPWVNVTNNNLFNKYWRSQVEEITDKNSHLLTAQIILTEIDMINLDLRDTIQADNVYYRINKITHNPLNNIAEVELIRQKDYIPFTPSIVSSLTVADKFTKPLKFGGGTFTEIGVSVLINPRGIGISKMLLTPYIMNRINPMFNLLTEYTILDGVDNWNPNLTKADIFGDWIPKKDYYPTKNPQPGNNFISLQAGHVVSGKQNFIDPSSNKVKVNGDNNNIGKGCENITITGNNNQIWGGVKNITIVGDDQVVKVSDTTYIGGITRNISMIISPTNNVGTGGVIRGGKNSVSANRIINGGQDR